MAWPHLDGDNPEVLYLQRKNRQRPEKIQIFFKGVFFDQWRDFANICYFRFQPFYHESCKISFKTDALKVEPFVSLIFFPISFSGATMEVRKDFYENSRTPFFRFKFRGVKMIFGLEQNYCSCFSLTVERTSTVPKMQPSFDIVSCFTCFNISKVCW